MAIVKMSKFSLLTFAAKKEELLHELQKFQYVHFLNLKENEDLLELGSRKSKYRSESHPLMMKLKMFHLRSIYWRVMRRKKAVYNL